MKVEVFVKKEENSIKFHGHFKYKRSYETWREYDFLYDDFMITSKYLKYSKIKNISEFIFFESISRILNTRAFGVFIDKQENNTIEFSGVLDDDFPAGGDEQETYAGLENIRRFIFDTKFFDCDILKFFDRGGVNENEGWEV